MSKTLGLVLGAGGSRGACHLGVLKALEENDIKPDYISGCSMGAVIGGIYATGTPVEEIEPALMSLKLTDIMDLTPVFLSSLGILRGDAAEKIIAKYLRTDDPQATEIPFNCVATDLLSGNIMILDSGSLIKNIRCSMSIPAVFQPVEMDDCLYVDGGLLCRVPIMAMKKFNPDVTIAFDALGDLHPESKPKNAIALLIRSFNLTDYTLTNTIKNTCDLFMELDNPQMSSFDIKSVKPSFDAGYEITIQHMSTIKQLLE